MSVVYIEGNTLSVKESANEIVEQINKLDGATFRVSRFLTLTLTSDAPVRVHSDAILAVQ